MSAEENMNGQQFAGEKPKVKAKVMADGLIYVGDKSVGRVRKLDNYQVVTSRDAKWRATGRTGSSMGNHFTKAEAVHEVAHAWLKNANGSCCGRD